MEFSAVFGFLIIINESIKLLPKNGKSMASITILSLVLPSILFLLFSYFYQSLATYMTNDSGYIPYRSAIYSALLLLVEIPFLLASIAILNSSVIATILILAMSYTGQESSLEDLFSTIKRKWTRQLSNNFHRSKNPKLYVFLIASVLAAALVILHPNPITITILIVLNISFFVFLLYASVVWILSAVISVVEESCKPNEALEKAEKLVEGQRLHGFMLNLFFNLLLLLIILLGYWIISGGKWHLNQTTCGLFVVNSLSVANIFGSIMYTVFYFQCKKYHGQEISVPVISQFTKLPNDVP